MSGIPIKNRIFLYAKLIRLHKPIGIFLLLWPTLWATWIAADGHIDLKILLIFITGVILIRSAGCAINDYADRDYDRHVARTKDRPVATGAVSPKEALLIFIVLSLLAFALVLFLNALTIQLAVVALILVASYPFMKRLTYYPQAYLGLAFAWSVPMAYAAQSNTFGINAWLLLIASVVWTMAYDTMYAMVDREDDIKIGVKSTAILFADGDRLMIGLLQLSFLIMLAIIGGRLEFGLFYHFGIAGAAAFCFYQQWLIRLRQPEKCLQAFLNNNYLGMVVFFGIFSQYQWG